MMEPLSVLGLVANIVQLIDAAAKAYTVCCEIHASGSSKEDSRTAFTSEQFREAYDELVRVISLYIVFLRLLGPPLDQQFR